MEAPLPKVRLRRLAPTRIYEDVKQCPTCGCDLEVNTSLGWAFVRTSILLHLEHCGPEPKDRDECRLEAGRMANRLLARHNPVFASL